MRIKKLELIGFKSFKDRTVIQFDQGITGVVGPNGCGKSNIVDALVWVMGEMSAKHLRGTTMSDVIFAGAEGYSPMGMAEVTLTLENDGGPFPAQYLNHSEIMITRRLHRSGETEYLINKEQARLRDIQEIFMDTGAGSKGFSIIEQGSIGKIVMSKPEERRVLIEEAAGITKFKVRKRESKKKLQATEQNLVRLQDILGEQQRQLDSLERQAQRAERYRKLKEELRERELKLAIHQFKSQSETLQNSTSLLGELTHNDESLDQEKNTLELWIQTLRLQVTEKQSGIEQQQRVVEELQLKIRQKEEETRNLAFEIEQSKRDRQMTGTLLAQALARQEALQAEATELTSLAQAADEEFQKISENLRVAKGKLTELENRLRDSESLITQKRRETIATSQSESSLTAKRLSLEGQLDSLNSGIEAKRTDLHELRNQLVDFEARFKRINQQVESERQLQLEIMRDFENFEANLTQLKAEILEKETEERKLKDAHGLISANLAGLENLQASFEGFDEGVKRIMNWQKQNATSSKSGFRPMAEVIEVVPNFEAAMNAALGADLQVVLCTSVDQGMSGVSYLKSEKAGRSSFFPPETVAQLQVADSATDLTKEPGVLGILSNYVQVPEEYRAQVRRYTDMVGVVENLDTALQLRTRYPQFSFVTKEGDALTRDGVLSGGDPSTVESGVLKRRREIRDLVVERDEVAGKLALIQLSLKKLYAQMETVTNDLEQARIRQTEKEIALIELRKDLERAEGEYQFAQRDRQKREHELSAIEAQIQSLSDSREKVLEHEKEMVERRLTLEEEVSQLEKSIQGDRFDLSSAQELNSQLMSQNAVKEQELKSLSAQLDRVKSGLKEIETQLGSMRSKTIDSDEQLTQNERALETSKVELESMIGSAKFESEKVSGMREAFEQESTKIRESEERFHQVLQKSGATKAQLLEIKGTIAQTEMQIKYLTDQVYERHMVTIEQWMAQNPLELVIDEITLQAFENEATELRDKLAKIGEVNLSAIQEYEEIKQRFEFLSAQHKDLLDAKDQLQKVIDRINKICTKKFDLTFEMVNERFQKVFPTLFGGGEASLVLVADEDSDEKGIDIFARPPGKKLQSVSLLSGGEKALTAVSLIFAIFLVKPSPFCLLDEVDAPLDDANVYRFNDLVREMAKRSQIIVVTHNKHTMQINDRLYGVTMEEKGVSKMVTVALNSVLS